MRNLLIALDAAAETDRGVQFFDRNGIHTILSYQNLAVQSRSAALAILDLAEPADRVAIIGSTSPELVTSIFASMHAGVIPFCLATPRLGRGPDYVDSTVRMLRTAKCNLILAEDSQASALQKVAEGSGAKIIPFSQILAGVSGKKSLPDLRDLPAMIQYSSGTTIHPKPIILTHKNIIENTNAILARFPGDLRDHSGMSWLPLHHDMGLIGGLFCAVVGKGNITLLRPDDFVLRPALWLKGLSDSRATISPCPNFALKLCTDRISEEDIHGLDLSAWRIALIGAEMVHEKTLSDFYQKFKSTGLRYSAFTPVYGLAEATLAVSFSQIEKEPKFISFDSEILSRGSAQIAGSDSRGVTIGSVGTSLDNVEIQIRSELGETVSDGTLGGIFVRGPTISPGYFSPEPAAIAIDENGWLDTGDLGFFFQGELYIHGRKKDLIIINGRNHDPASVEFAVDDVAGLRHDRAAAFALDTPEKATESFIVIVEREKGQAATDELAIAARDAVTARTGLIPASVHIVEVGRLPRTTSGKIRRGEARRKHIEKELEYLASSR